MCISRPWRLLPSSCPDLPRKPDPGLPTYLTSTLVSHSLLRGTGSPDRTPSAPPPVSGPKSLLRHPGSRPRVSHTSSPTRRYPSHPLHVNTEKTSNTSHIHPRLSGDHLSEELTLPGMERSSDPRHGGTPPSHKALESTGPTTFGHTTDPHPSQSGEKRGRDEERSESFPGPEIVDS